MNNPYKDIDKQQFWKYAVTQVDLHQLDPVTNPKFKLEKTDKIATAGSCFAQHLANRLANIGYNYYVTEEGTEISDIAERKRRGFGVFSARYGNIYTARQLAQLFSEAVGAYHVQEQPWQRADGRYVDPFRPNIEPEGFPDIKSVIEARRVHLQAVLKMFQNMDIFVFTLGLTEGWINKTTGEVFPLAPGVAGGSFDPEKYEFKNFTVNEILDDMNVFLSVLRRINPKVKVLLTVSPVPLIATYEKQHALTATTYSKSVLRVAAGMLAAQYDWVEYFPSYEIITGHYNMGRYFAEDLREVTPLGVSHVMRSFLKHYAEQKIGVKSLVREPEVKDYVIICDEEMIHKTIE